jgi:hypothetical protein
LDTLPVLLHHDGDCEKKLVPKENPWMLPLKPLRTLVRAESCPSGHNI